MNLQILITLYQRDLEKLKKEILAYTNEKDLWKKVDGINNSAGNLALHLIGNLNYFIGATLGNTGFVRDREAEFSSIDVPKKQLLEDIEEVSKIVGEALTNLPLERLTQTYPVQLRGQDYPVDTVLIQMLTHLSYHLGQVNYHRRIFSDTTT